MITKASLEDAGFILELQRAAYRSEAILYNDFSIPPLKQELEELEAEFEAKIVLKQVLDNRLVGSVRAWDQGGTCYIERLIVHPEFQGRGIGTALMNEIEQAFPDSTRFELFTGHKSVGNIRLMKGSGTDRSNKSPSTAT